jgi:hypothetical protein
LGHVRVKLGHYEIDSSHFGLLGTILSHIRAKFVCFGIISSRFKPIFAVAFLRSWPPFRNMDPIEKLGPVEELGPVEKLSPVEELGPIEDLGSLDEFGPAEE